MLGIIMKKEVNIHIGRKLTALLKSQGITSKFEASKFLDIPEARLREYEYGKCSIPYWRLIEFAGKFDIRPGYFIDDFKKGGKL